MKTLRINTPLHAWLTDNETAYVEVVRTLAEKLLQDLSLATTDVRVARAFLCTLG